MRVSLFQHPMIIGMDVNYHAFIHDTLHPDGWVDVTKKVPAISAFWAQSGLVDCQPAANPGKFEPTFFSTEGGEPLNDAGNFCIPVQKLLPQCRAATRIDVVAVSLNFLLEHAPWCSRPALWCQIIGLCSLSWPMWVFGPSIPMG